MAGLAGCEEPSSSPPAPPPPAPAGGGTQQSGSNGALSGLSEQPKSLLGRSAKTARDVVAQAENKQAEAVGMAGEMSGETASLEITGLVWSAPTAWERVQPANAMRKAELHVKSPDGEGEAVVTFSTGIGGSVEANIDRWAGQFLTSGGPAVPMPKHRIVAGVTVTLVELDGTYKDSMPGAEATERPGYALKGAVVEGPQGTVFIKMVGPKAVVDQAGSAWAMMIDGMRKKPK